MTEVDEIRRDEALAWVRRIGDPDFADWDAHIAWLEASSDNARAFDAVATAIAAASAGLGPASTIAPGGTTVPANDNAANPRARRHATRRLPAIWAGGMAAALVAVVSLPSLLRDDASSYQIRTSAGERRSVALPGGVVAMLGGASALRLDRTNPRSAVVEAGEVLFTVTHDAASPFVVRAGDSVFRDIGTVFDVKRTGSGVRLAVREGAVLFDPDGARVTVGGGRALVANEDGVVIRDIDARSVGDWRDDRLNYVDAPMGEVADDLARASGRAVTIDREAAGRLFSGVIVVDPDQMRLSRRIAAATGLAVHPAGRGLRIAAAAR